MATQGTEKVLGGTPYKRYPDPNVKGTPNQFGLYPWSTFDAQLVSDLDGNGTAVLLGGEEGSAADILLFTSDFPATCRAVCTDLGAQLQFSNSVKATLATDVAVTTPGGSTSATIVNYGQVIRGYSGGANDVFVTGFPVNVVLNAPGAAGSTSYITLEVQANGGVINGVVGPLNVVGITGNDIPAPTPIILAKGAYTQAIKDNDNILQLTKDTTIPYQVVGLYKV